MAVHWLSFLVPIPNIVLFLSSVLEYLTVRRIAGFDFFPLITVDFNFHVECQSDNDAKCFAEILQTYGLHQHVLVPTHESGHTLDLIITRSNNDIRVSTPKATMAPSDHNFIECKLDLPRPCLTINEIYYRKLRSIDIEAFKADISASLLCKSS